MISENGSSSAAATTASIPVDQQPLQQKANIAVGKEVTDNGDNVNSDGNGKQGSNHEDSDLQEWYRTFLI